MQEALSHGPVSQLLPCDLLPLEEPFESQHCCPAAGSLQALPSHPRWAGPDCLIATPIKVMDQESFPLETQSF